MFAIHVEMPISTKGVEPWTDGERRKLMDMRKRRATFLEIGRELRRSERACRCEWEKVQIEDAWRLEGAPVKPRKRGRFGLFQRRAGRLESVAVRVYLPGR